MSFLFFSTGNRQKNNTDSKSLKLRFGNSRTDRNLVNSLTGENGAINKPKQRLIGQAIKNLSKDNSSENITFLMDVADNLKYGIKQGSGMADFIEQGSNISSEKLKQNNDWNAMLKASIRTALDNNTDADKAELESKYAKLFPKKEQAILESGSKAAKNYWISSNNSSEEAAAKDAKNYRDSILNSEEFNKSTEQLSGKEKKALDLQKDSIKKNIDYFLASSECSTSEKKECLNTLSTFMSPEYKINQQLTGKKVQVLSETLNNLIVKNPNKDVLTSKDTNQLRHGMCVAISATRKALPYEHKLAFVNNLVGTLSDSPTMEVYDATDTARKITIKKPFIDYKEAISEKHGTPYRIIDAAVFNWMNVGDATGTGEVQTGRYKAFDAEHYGMLQDSHLTLDFPKEKQADQNVYRSTVKIKRLTDSINADNVKRDSTKRDIAELESNLNNTKSSAYSSVTDTIKDLFPNTTDKKETKALNTAIKLLNPELVTDKSFQIHHTEEPYEKKLKLKSIIKQEIPSVSEDNLDKKVDKILVNLEKLTTAKKEYNAEKNATTPAAIARINKKLFKLAAYSRVQKEYELDMPKRLIVMSAKNNVPTKEVLLNQRVNSLQKGLTEGTLDSKIPELAQKFNVKNDKSDVLKYLDTVDKVSKSLSLKKEAAIKEAGLTPSNKKEIAKNYVEDLYTKVKEEKTNGYNTKLLSHDLGINPKSKDVAEYLDETIAKINLAKDDNGFNKAIARVGLDNSALAKIHVQNQIDNAKYINISGDMSDQASVENALNSAKKNIEKYTAIQKKLDVIDNADAKITKMADTIGAKTPKDIILKSMESKGTVLSRKTLDSLENKFNNIEQYASGTNKNLDKSVYEFSNKENQIFGKIQNDFPETLKESKLRFKTVNDALAPELDKVYNKMAKGQGTSYWVSEEGHSGLNDNQQIRIFSEATAKPSFVEYDVTKALDHAQSGKNTNILMSNLCDSKYSGHAQYMNDVHYYDVRDPKTGKIVKERGFECDNTWGAVETEHTWKDSAGNLRTNYGSETNAPKGGFLTNKHMTEGLLEKDFLGKPGVNESWLLNNKKMRKVDSSIGSKYSLYMSSVVGGELPTRVLDKNAMNLAGALKRRLVIPASVNQFVDNLQNGFNVDKEGIKNIDANVASLNKWANRTIKGKFSPVYNKFGLSEELKNVDLKNAFESRENFDKIPENHPIKFELKKASMANLAQSLGVSEDVFGALTPEALKKADKNVLDAQKDMAKAILNKPVKDLDNFVLPEITSPKDLEDVQGGQGLLNFIDNKFKPKSDKAFMAKFNELKQMPDQEFDKLISNNSLKDFGLAYDDPFILAERIRSYNSEAGKELSYSILRTNIQKGFDNIDVTYKNTYKGATKEQIAKNKMTNSLYRSFNMNLSGLETDKSLKRAAARVINKYGSRPVYNNIVVASKEQLEANVAGKLMQIKKIALQNSLLKQYASSNPDAAQALSNKITKNQKALNTFVNNFVKTNVVSKKRNSVTQMANNLVKELNTNANSDRAASMTDKLLGEIVDNHLLNHPDKLLKQMTEEIPHMTEASDAPIINAWKAYLSKSLMTANNLSVENTVKGFVKEGTIGQIANHIKKPENSFVVMAATKEVLPLKGKGVSFFLKSLKDPTNNNSSLKYTLQQLGLVDSAVDYISENLSTKTLNDKLTAIKDSIKSYDVHKNSINDIFGESLQLIKKSEPDKMFEVPELRRLSSSLIKRVKTDLSGKGVTDLEQLKDFKDALFDKIQELTAEKHPVSAIETCLANALDAIAITPKDLDTYKGVVSSQLDMLKSFKDVMTPAQIKKAATVEEQVVKHLKQVRI